MCDDALRLSRVDDATSSEFCTKLWAGLTSEMALRDCEIYSYVQASIAHSQTDY